MLANWLISVKALLEADPTYTVMTLMPWDFA
jgi:hypothetical protein